jgi:hypothetical protein
MIRHLTVTSSKETFEQCPPSCPFDHLQIASIEQTIARDADQTTLDEDSTHNS